MTLDVAIRRSRLGDALEHFVFAPARVDAAAIATRHSLLPCGSRCGGLRREAHILTVSRSERRPETAAGGFVWITDCSMRDQ